MGHPVEDAVHEAQVAGNRADRTKRVGYALLVADLGLLYGANRDLELVPALMLSVLATFLAFKEYKVSSGYAAALAAIAALEAQNVF